MANVVVIGEDGFPYEIDSGKLSEAQASGFRLETEPEAQARIKTATLKGPLGMAAALPLGIARGLSFGGTDYLTKKGEEAGILPEGSTDTVKQIKDLNPQSSTIGEVGSLFVPGLGALAAAKEAKAAGALLKGAGSGQRAVTGVGTAVEKAAQKIIGDNIAGKLIGGAARGLTEAELYNIGHNLSEASLGNQDLTAETLLAHSGDAAMIGAGLGFGIPAVGGAISATVKKAKSALDALGGTLAKALPAAATVASEGVIGMAGKLGTADTAVLREAMQNAGTEEGLAMREGLLKGADAERRNVLMNQFQTEMKTTLSELDDATHTANAQFRKVETAKLLEDVDFENAWKKAVDLSASAKAVGAEILEDPLLYKGTYGRTLVQIGNQIDTKLAAATSAHDVFDIINTSKQTALADLSEFKRNLSMADRDVVNSLQKVRDVYRGFAGHLEDGTIYGEGAARQAAFNDALSTHLTAEKNFRTEFMKPKTVKGGVVYEIAPSKVNTFFNQMGSERGAAKLAALNDFMDSGHALLDEIQKSSTVGSASGAWDKAGLESLMKRTAGIQQTAQDELAQVNKLRALDNGMAAILHSPLGAGKTLLNRAISSPTATMGGIVGGFPGAAVGSAIDAGVNAARNPIEAVKMLAKVEALTLRTSKQISKALDSFISKGSSAVSAGYDVAKPFVGPLSVQALYHTKLGDGIKAEKKEQQNKLDLFNKQRSKIAEMVSAPDITTARFAKGFQSLQGAAPLVAAKMASKQMDIITYLAEKMPKNPTVPLNKAMDRWTPSTAEVAKFERILTAATNPRSILHDLDTGTITKDSVDAVRDLYPEFYGDIVAKLTDKITTIKEPLPYKTLSALSVMFGQSFDQYSLTPEFTAIIQTGYKQQSGKEDSPSGKPLNMKFNNEMSQTERLANK